ncbi:hypothetical protein B0A55_05981 [Friedmanniomyces simplex]|uniref:phosphoribosylformylglycinamidine cyclo-ligase n=1 Tax=Friedmanniomyces simplex TaxID=329884 RepID=A0A4U0X7W2_9PEZI|nr:hypothetical protein B0A55_05981 [Friedmanniomyces simplex]
MNVNDLVVQGAEPLTFLDYFACGKLDVGTVESFVEGVAEGCRQAGCALVGGETAEMPSMYADGEYDAAGTATGAIRRGDKLLPRKESMVAGDVLLGLQSNGVHSNGFSLVRKILEKEKLDVKDAAPWNKSVTVAESLLTPTRIYVKPCLEVHRRGLVKGMAHITGGGLLENVPRMLPDSLASEIDVSAWEMPAVFQWLQRAGDVTAAEMARVFNNGIGMVLVVPAAQVNEAESLLQEAGETSIRIGVLVERTGEACLLKKLESWK